MSDEVTTGRRDVYGEAIKNQEGEIFIEGWSNNRKERYILRYVD